ncbi:MAG TPA: DEAD/DEAH box helicase family protein, partial [Marmoricola sp.]|nr:DEAD/DEAH box helicase family protein [Marmoricola sp.]
MPPRKQAAVAAQTAACVPGIRIAVDEWRGGGYQGVTDTTRTLMNHWFVREHRDQSGKRFAYYPAQREAIETLIYLYEVAGVRRHKDLLEAFSSTPGLHILQYDDFARYAVKMATGSGKTKVMSLVIAWQYFNAVAEGREDYAKTFLLLAPNVIVFDRLRSDFVNGNIFKLDPVIPPELRIYWDMAFYMRHDGEGVGSQGAVYLTNIQQLYQSKPKEADEPLPMTAVLGAAPSNTINEQQELADRLV